MQRVKLIVNRAIRCFVVQVQAIGQRLRSAVAIAPTIRALVMIALIVGFWVDSPVAIAQESTPAPSNALEDVAPTPPSLDADAIASEKVTQFVRSYLKVLGLIEQREGELQAAETDSESQRVQDEIEAAAIAIIEAEGMTLQEYVQLLGLVNSDPDFSERIALQLQEAGS